MSGEKTTCLFVVMLEMYHPHYGYELYVIWPGDDNIHGTNFFCGHDFELATEYANELNLQMGFSVKKATEIYERVSGLDCVRFFDV